MLCHEVTKLHVHGSVDELTYYYGIDYFHANSLFLHLSCKSYTAVAATAVATFSLLLLSRNVELEVHNVP